LAYQAETQLPPFLSQDMLAGHALLILERAGQPDVYQKWTMVMLHNETERPLLVDIPYNQRLMLLPQCLRKKGICTATFDAMGLLCNSCGACHIDPFLTEAEDLGYATLVSEGTAAVMSVVQSGQVAAFVGVSCLSTLEKVFPFMSTFKLPAIAVPLMQDDCMRTEVDADWVREYLYARAPGSEDIPPHCPFVRSEPDIVRLETA